MASIKILLREDKLDQSGEAPLFLRIIKDRKTKFMTLGSSQVAAGGSVKMRLRVLRAFRG